MEYLSKISIVLALIPAITLIWITTVASMRVKGNIWLATQIELSVIFTLPMLYLIASALGGIGYLLWDSMGFYTGFALVLSATQLHLLRGGYALR